MAISSASIKKLKESSQLVNNNGKTSTSSSGSSSNGSTTKSGGSKGGTSSGSSYKGTSYTAPSLGNTYNANTDYQAIIDNAVRNGDYVTAAKAEQLRNQKIDATNSPYTKTNMYTGYLQPDYGSIGQQQMANNASSADVFDTFYSRQNKALTTQGLEQYANDEIQQKLWQYAMNKMYEENNAKAKSEYEDLLAELNQGKPEEYQSKYDPKIDALLNEILNREDFSYDAMSDPLYQQYAKMYQREGDRAMKETLAEAAAGAGGMNTYAITAAQQANSYYNSQLNDKIPELARLAYNMYLNDKESKVQDLGILQNMDATQYGRYRDTMNDFYNDRNFAYGAYQDAVQQGNWQNSFDYNSMLDNRNWNNEQYWANKEWNYNDMWKNKEWDYNDEWKNKEYSDNRADIEYERNQAEEDEAKATIDWLIQNGVSSIDPELIAKAGLSQTAVNQAVANYKAEQTKKGSSGGGGSGKGNGDGNGNGGGYDNGSLSTEQVKKLQTKLGVTADGLWGSGSEDAAGGLSADEAWEKHFGGEGTKLPYATGDEKWDATGNYKTIEEDCKSLLMTKGKEGVLAYLKRTLETGAIDIYSYMTLVNKYRG